MNIDIARHWRMVAYIMPQSMTTNIMRAKDLDPFRCWNNLYIAVKYIVDTTAVMAQKEHPIDLRIAQNILYPGSNDMLDRLFMTYDNDFISFS